MKAQRRPCSVLLTEVSSKVQTALITFVIAAAWFPPCRVFFSVGLWFIEKLREVSHTASVCITLAFHHPAEYMLNYAETNLSLYTPLKWGNQ